MRVTLAAFALALVTAAAAPAATLLVGNKSDDTVDLIDLTSGVSYATLPTGNAPHEIAVSPDGRTAVVTDYGDRETPGASLTVVDVATARVVRSIDLGHHTRPHGAAWLSAEQVVVTTEGSAHLIVVNPHTGAIEARIETGQSVSHMVAVTPDGGAGRRAFVANIGSGSVTAIDLRAGVKLEDIATGEGAEGIAVTPDGGEIWVTNRASDTLSVIDPESLEVIATIPCAGFPIRIQITPDGSRALVSAARSGEVVLFDVAARRELRRAKLDLSSIADDEGRLFAGRFGDSPVPVGLVIAPAGDVAWVAATQSDAVVAIDPETLEVRGVLNAGREPDGMAWSEISPPAAAAAPAGLDGRALFLETHRCQLCHGVPAAGVEARVKSVKMRGPDLGGPLAADFATLAGYVRGTEARDGDKHAKPFKGSDEELQAIFAWLAGLAAE